MSLIPAHVPAELVVDIDMYDLPEKERDPQLAWRAYQGKGPFVFSPHNGGHWIATEGEDVFRFFRDFATFSSRTIYLPDQDGDLMYPIQADPPLHAEYRRNIVGFFTPSAVAQLEKGIREETVSLIEAFKGKGQCEFVEEFALQLPLTIFLNMMGLPLDDRMYLHDLVDVFVDGTTPEARANAHAEIHAYLDKWLDARIAEPADDAITAITQATIKGRPYTREEMLGTCTLLLHAGLDTVTNMLGFIAHHLARTPADRAYIRQNRDKYPQIIQEFLRRFPVPNLARVLTRDFDHKGVRLRKGDKILLPPSLFNIDKSVVPDAEDVDLQRIARHITFGAGPHTCAGALLARKELEIFLEEFLGRIPDFSLHPDHAPRMKAAGNNTMSELWLKWA